jgi:hypothetical protein
MGQLSILNVYEGDVEITFDNNNAAEAIRARRIISDMLQRGYALLIEVEPGVYQRAVGFDEKAGKYIIADFDPSYRPKTEGSDEDNERENPEEEAETETPPKIRSQRGRPRRSIAMESTSAVAVARSAGG